MVIPETARAAYLLMILCDLLSMRVGVGVHGSVWACWACAGMRGCAGIVQTCAGVCGHGGYAPVCAGVCGYVRVCNNYEFSEYFLETNVFMQWPLVRILYE